MYAIKIVFLVLALVVAVVQSAPSHGRSRRSHRNIHVAREPVVAREAVVARSSVGRSSCRPRTSSAGASSSAVVSSTAVSSTAVSSTVVSVPTSVSNVNKGARTTTSATSERVSSSAVEKTSSTATHVSSQGLKASLSSSSAKVSATASSSTSKTGNSLLAKLFPVAQNGKSWTTAADGSSLPLSDSTLNPKNLLSALSHDYVTFEGKTAMKAHYPKGSYTYTHKPQGGLSFYAPGPSSVDLTTAKEATFGYSVYFDEGFAFNLGGKLPGLYGGNSDSEAISCSGGRRSSACFSARLMWRSEGKGEFYTYLPPSFSANKRVCNVAPESDCNAVYGASVGRGAFKFATGAWTTISERVKLNDVGKENGEIELFVNGVSVISVNGLVLRDSSAGRIRGIQMQTFFGGSSPNFASPKDQNVHFADFSAAITETL